MAAHFVCLTAGGGVPLFFRNKGNLKPLPFPVIGSLNGVHMFCAGSGAELQSTRTEDSLIVWKVYHNSLVLVLVCQSDNSSLTHHSQLLDVIFHSLVLVYGLDDLINIKNIERFKKEIRVCYKLVDRLLEFAESPTFSCLTHAVDVIAAPENTSLQTYLDAFVESANSPYGCVLVEGKVAVATKKWWEFSSAELVLLALLVSSLPMCSSRDIPVFLPQTSPTVPHRLLTLQLTHQVALCVVCGPTPSLAQLETEVERFWRSALECVRSVARASPRNIPQTICLDPQLQGFLLVNAAWHRCLSCVHPGTADTKWDPKLKVKGLNVDERRAALGSFYRKVVGTLWPSGDRTPHSEERTGDVYEQFSQPAMETYLCSDKHKFYALQRGSHQLFALFTPSIPTYALRSVAHRTLDTLQKDKNISV